MLISFVTVIKYIAYVHSLIIGINGFQKCDFLVERFLLEEVEILHKLCVCLEHWLDIK